MFRHHEISHDYQAVALASLFEHGEKAVAAPRGAQKREAAIARTRDKVQVTGAVVAMQAARHDKDDAISGIAAHPCKKRKDRAARFHHGKGSTERGKGGPAPRRSQAVPFD